VAEYGRLANQAEGEKKYQNAYDYYIKALDIFSHMVKCKTYSPRLNLSDEKNPKLIEIYKTNQLKYLMRAEEIKKEVLKPDESVS
jgi:hypothetical protein